MHSKMNNKEKERKSKSQTQTKSVAHPKYKRNSPQNRSEEFLSASRSPLIPLVGHFPYTHSKEKNFFFLHKNGHLIIYVLRTFQNE